ncbi:MAG: hypothetical protein MZV63_24665 [Marinilabiliales bacterium]|nr:hypothetical protein [Marinilabiliales bacterium]
MRSIKWLLKTFRNIITDEKIEILGDPLPKTDEQEKIDFETQDDFTFLI